jgi:phosphopantetheinyl transferase (holo-ACP synthase)
MMSIGNDIVSLAHINVQRTITPQFYSKFVTPEEILLYKGPACAGLSFEAFIWLVWSVKESAYKYLSRLQTDLVFSPLKMKIREIHRPKGVNLEITSSEIESETLSEDHYYSCIVHHNGVDYHGSSFANNHFIHSIVTRDETVENVKWGIKNMETDDIPGQSAAVRAFAKHSLVSAYPLLNLEFSKNNAGCPVMLNEGNETGIPISFTHHYQFIAYAYLSDLL